MANEFEEFDLDALPATHPLWSKTVTVVLTVYEAHLARGAARHQARSRSRSIEKLVQKFGDAVRPDQIAATRRRAETLDAAATKLSRAVRIARNVAGVR